MDAKEILEKMRKEDRLLKESAVMKAVQKAMIEMGYEPLGDEVQKIFATIENVSQICTVGEFQNLKETKCKYWNAEHGDCALNYAEIRTKAIDEFTERMKAAVNENYFFAGEFKNWTLSAIGKIAEEMKGAE